MVTVRRGCFSLVTSGPYKSQTLQRSDSFFGDVTGRTVFELFVLSPLMVHPRPQPGILGVVGGDQAVALTVLEGLQFSKALQPCRFMRIPAKPDLVELLGPPLGHVRRLALFHQRVMPSLLFHPQTELWKLGVVQRNATMPRFGTEQLQVFQVTGPG